MVGQTDGLECNSSRRPEHFDICDSTSIPQYTRIKGDEMLSGTSITLYSEMLRKNSIQLESYLASY